MLIFALLSCTGTTGSLSAGNAPGTHVSGTVSVDGTVLHSGPGLGMDALGASTFSIHLSDDLHVTVAYPGTPGAHACKEDLTVTAELGGNKLPPADPGVESGTFVSQWGGGDCVLELAPFPAPGELTTGTFVAHLKRLTATQDKFQTADIQLDFTTKYAP